MSRILVVDDEPAITALIAEILTFFGYEVTQAGGGVEAIARARETHPDLILLDVMMPDLDGRDTCKVLKMDLKLRDVPIILVSSADEQDVHWRGADADGFLQKPFSIRDLPERVSRFLDAGA